MIARIHFALLCIITPLARLGTTTHRGLTRVRLVVVCFSVARLVYWALQR